MTNAYTIPFNKPHLTGKEMHYIYEAVATGKISGNGVFTKRCQAYFTERYGFGKSLLTSSCTDALEMCALLLDIQPGDEVIVPSYTFVSSANAFVLRGANIVFADSYAHHPNVDPASVEQLITDRTRAIVAVHYAGVACDMDALAELAKPRGIVIVEDAAQAIDSYYKGTALGSIGALSAFSFHETKNVISGEGGMLAVNDTTYADRAEIIWEKGTNRSAFFRGEVDKYGWVDVGSSFLPSEVTAAFLYAQLQELDRIQVKRKQLWEIYHERLAAPALSAHFEQPSLPAYATNNAHMYYIVLYKPERRASLITHLKAQGILAVFHYLSLQQSPFYSRLGSTAALVNADKFAERLLRLPLYVDLEPAQVHLICDHIEQWASPKA